MSLQKIKSAKNITYTDRYSKNPIINTLIKNKLQNQMVVIKQNFTNIIKKQQQPQPLKSSSRIALKRNRSYTINPKMISEASQYNPIDKINKITQQFVVQRQTDSFLLSPLQLDQINKARQQHSGLTTKLLKTDVINYETPKNLKTFTQNIKQGIINEHSQQVWLPNKPQIEFMISDKKQQIQNQYVRERGKTKQQVIQKQLQNFTNRITGFSTGPGVKQFGDFPLKTFKTIGQNSNMTPAEYIHQRYHKNDYKLIQKWLECTISQISKQKKDSTEKLNMVYSCYMCVWKQLIRLTYIQSQQKGLIVQKMFYSMLKLFWGLITEQQQLARVFNRQSQSELKGLNKVMEKRMQQIMNQYNTQYKQFQKLKQQNLKLSKVFISFERVNHQIVNQLQKMTNQKKHLQKQFNSLNHSYFKTLQILYDKKFIQMEFKNQQSKQLKSIKKFHTNISYKTFFIFDQQSKPKILGRFKYQDVVPNPNPRYADKGLQQTFSSQLRKYQQRYGHNIKQIQNQLNRFWQKKQNDIQMKGIIDSLVLQVRMVDQSVGTTQFQKSQFTCQFPQSGQDFVQKQLRELRQQLTAKFSMQRKQLQSQIQQKDIALQKWKQNSQQMQQKYKSFQQNIQKQNENIKKMKQNNSQLLQQIESIAKEQQKYKKQVQELKVQLQNSKNMEQQAYLMKQKMQRQKNSMLIEVEKQKQNNKYLVRGNLEMKQKVEKYDIRYNNLLRSVKNLAPWLQKFINNIDRPLQQLDINLFKKISAKIQQQLSQFVTKDSSLFMTRVS